MSGGQAAPFTPAGGRSGDSLTRADRIVVTMLAALLGGTLVGFVAIGGQLVGLQRQIGEVRTDMTGEIGDLHIEMRSELGDLRTEMHSEFGKLSDRLTGVETRLTSVETRLTSVETRLTSAETRLTSVETLIQTRLVPAPDPRDPAGP